MSYYRTFDHLLGRGFQFRLKMRSITETFTHPRLPALQAIEAEGASIARNPVIFPIIIRCYVAGLQTHTSLVSPRSARPRPVLQGFRHMRHLYPAAVFQIGNRPAQFDDAVVTSGTQLQPSG